MGAGANYNLLLLGIGAVAVILWAHYKVRPKLDLEFRFKEFFLVVFFYNLVQTIYMSMVPGEFQIINAIIQSVGFFTIIYGAAYGLEVFVHNHFDAGVPSTHKICDCECACCVGEHNEHPVAEME